MSLLSVIRRILGLEQAPARKTEAKRDIAARPPAQPKPLPPTPPSGELIPSPVVKHKPDKYFTLGVDFGTHETKIAFRDVDLNYDKTEVIVLSEAGREGRGECIVPSIITIFDDCLYFGKMIEGGYLIENFKMQIGETSPEPYSMLPYTDLSTLFIAYVVCESAKEIERRYLIYTCKIMLHLGSPLSDLHAGDTIMEAYDRILKLAWRLYWFYGGMLQGIAIDKAFELIEELNARTLKNEKEWCWLVPEIQAAVTSFAQSADVPPYSYHIVIDVGGFTTDVSVFNVGHPQQQPNACIFASSVIKQAIIDFDSAKNKVEFIKDLRQNISDVIIQCTNKGLLDPGQFVNFAHKAIWRIGGGYFRPDFLDELLHPNNFLPGHRLLDRKPRFRSNTDIMFLVAKGLATFHNNFTAILRAQPLPPFQPPLDDRLPYHLQDHN